MTQSQAFTILQAIFPGENIAVTRDRTMRTGSELRNDYWLHADCLTNRCISSNRSWDHLIAIAKSSNEDIWPEVDDPVNDEVAA